MKLTDWYQQDVMPVHIGIYQRLYSSINGMIYYCYWDGKRWYAGADYIDGAIGWYDNSCRSTHLFPWRGVSKE